MASRSLGVVNLHISCGLGNAMGMLYNAYREGTPLLVTAGQQDRRLKFEEPILWRDMVEVARPWTKWAVEVDRVEDLPSAMRRAVQTALTPPTGPVFLSLPMDVQMEIAELDLTPAATCSTRACVRRSTRLQRAAEVLADGQESRHSRRQPRGRGATPCGELVRRGRTAGRAGDVRERARRTAGSAFPADHPLYAPGLAAVVARGSRAARTNSTCCSSSAWTCCGSTSISSRRGRFPSTFASCISIEDPWQLGKNYPLEVGLIGDRESRLGGIGRAVGRVDDRRRSCQARTRGRTARGAHRKPREAARNRSRSRARRRPMTPLTLDGEPGPSAAAGCGRDRRSGHDDEHLCSSGSAR